MSKSVDCEFGQIPEIVKEAIGLILPGGEEGLGEGGVLAGPEMDGGPVDAGVLGGGGDGLACDEGLEHLLLNGRKTVEKCRIGVAGHEIFPDLRLLPRAKFPESYTERSGLFAVI